MSFALLYKPIEIVEAQMLGPASMQEDHVLLALTTRNEYSIKKPEDVFLTRTEALRGALHRLWKERAKLEAELLLMAAHRPERAKR